MANICELEAPNLDAVDDSDELQRFALICENLSTYAKYKARAVCERKAGNIGAALYFEKEYELVYSLLPMAVRW